MRHERGVFHVEHQIYACASNVLMITIVGAQIYRAPVLEQ